VIVGKTEQPQIVFLTVAEYRQARHRARLQADRLGIQSKPTLKTA